MGGWLPSSSGGGSHKAKKKLTAVCKAKLALLGVAVFLRVTGLKNSKF